MTTFEIVSLIVNGVLTLATLGATAVAWTMAIASGRDKLVAESARDAAVSAQEKAAVALAAANTIAKDALEAQRLALPPEWGSPERVDGRNSYLVRNTSGRTVIVKELKDLPDGNAYVFLPPDLPVRVEHGDVVRFTAQFSGTASVAGKSVQLRWSYEDEPEVDSLTSRRY